jgi:hypothetical protein
MEQSVIELEGNAMKLPLKERSNYYKGLLILSRRDRVINADEKNLLLQIGELLGFEKRFCNATIDELLVNAHISRKPVIFSDESLRASFFRDAIRVAYSDGTLHPVELSWLRKTAHANGWTGHKLERTIQEFQSGEMPGKSASFEIQKHL